MAPPQRLLGLFEDGAVDHFLPLTWTRPVWEIRAAIFTLGERLAHGYGQPVRVAICRPALAPMLAGQQGMTVNAALPSPTLLLNGRLTHTPDLPRLIPLEGPPRIYQTPGGEVVAVRLPAMSAEALATLWPRLLGSYPAAPGTPPAFDPLRAFGEPRASAEALALAADLPRETLPVRLVNWPWEIIAGINAGLTTDAAHFPLGTLAGEIHPGAHLVNPQAIYVAQTAIVAPGVVLDARHGPIVIDEGAEVMANAALEGPLAVGPRSRVKMGARLYEGTAIGPVCKVGGEVEASIFQGYTNKQHDGFLGHSLLGAWCNLGAHTTNSDLKNNYSPVTLWTGRGVRETGELFIGLLMGDHTKTGIGMLFNTGTVIGVAANLYGAVLPPKFVPSFAWGSGNDLTTHRIGEAITTAQRVMARRNITLRGAEATLLRDIFEATAPERAPRLS